MDGDKEPMEFSLSEREIISTNLPTEKISNIFSKLQDTYTRQYKHQALIQRESKTFKLIEGYIQRTTMGVYQHQSLDFTLTNIIFPKLNISYYIFKGNVFYEVRPNGQLSNAYYLFSEQNIRNFYQSFPDLFSSTFPNPSQEEFLAIIYWHQNKIVNVESLCLPSLPRYSFQIPLLRTLASAFTVSYGATLSRESLVHFSDRPIWNLEQVARASFELLHLPFQAFMQSQYAVTLLDSLKKHIAGGSHRNTIRLLGHLSKGNLSSLSAFHDMIATIYLGHAYTDAVTTSKNSVSLIYCKNIRLIFTLIQQIFKSKLTSSTDMKLLLANNVQNDRSIYSEQALDKLYDELSVPNLLISELNGCLVNLSIKSSNRDIDILKELAHKKILRRKDDHTFKQTKYRSDMHYIYITDELPPTLPHNITVIELLGDLPKDHLFNEEDSSFIILLSLFNFFYPANDSIGAPAPVRYASDIDAVKKFISLFFADSTSEISSNRLNDAKREYPDKDLSKSEFDTVRIKKGKELGISDMEYTTSQDIEEAYRLWRSSDPDHIPNVKVIEIMRQTYDVLFYLKNNHATSRLHPEAGEKNVKCFFGLALDKERLTGAIASDAETSTANCQNELEASTLYYKNMIHTFQELQPKIRGELETLAQITLQANHGHIPLI